jgi:translation initiation factor 1
MPKARSTRFPPPPSETAGGAFDALAVLRGSLPQGAETPAVVERKHHDPPLAGKIVVRRERKERGGKTVTLIEGLALQGAALEAFARELRQALGTGGGVEDTAVVLAGDQVARAMAWLRARGATRLVAGN